MKKKTIAALSILLVIVLVFYFFSLNIVREEAQEKKEKLIDYLWSGNGLPARLPDDVQLEASGAWLHNMTNLRQTDILDIEMSHDINSVVYYFHANNSNGKLFLYHEGHQAKEEGEQTIQFLLANGYDVLAFSMPLYGDNRNPYNKSLPGHEAFRSLESDDFSPLSFFVEPVIVALNYAEQEHQPQSISMTGISGGGWTTTLAAAVDSRIDRSYSVGGSMPLRLRKNLSEGEYEETHPLFRDVFTYEDLYFLGAYGKGRERMQILNKFDPCCFSAYGYVSYNQSIRNALLSQLSDEFGTGDIDVLLTAAERDALEQNGFTLLPEQTSWVIEKDEPGGKAAADFVVGVRGTEKYISGKNESFVLPPYAFFGYEKDVQERLRNAGQGGWFAVYLDDTHREHKISENALRAIMEAEKKRD